MCTSRRLFIAFTGPVLHVRVFYGEAGKTKIKIDFLFLSKIKKSVASQKNIQKRIVNMATIGLIKESIAALKDRTGSSRQAITKWIESEKKVSPISM